MIDRLAIGLSRAADAAEHLAVHHYWLSVCVIAVPVLACITAVVIA